MSKIVTISNGKGGVGKSLQALQLTCRAAENGLNVLLLGAERDGPFDPKRSINKIENVTMLEGFSSDFARQIPVYREQYDLIVVDTAGNNLNVDTNEFDGISEQVIKRFIANADLVVIPIEPSEEAVRKTVSFARKLHKLGNAIGREIPQLLLPTNTKKNENMTQEMLSAIKQLPIPIAVRSVRSSADLTKAFAVRQGCWRYRRGAEVNTDLLAVHNQIFKLLGLK